MFSVLRTVLVFGEKIFLGVWARSVDARACEDVAKESHDICYVKTLNRMFNAIHKAKRAEDMDCLRRHVSPQVATARLDREDGNELPDERRVDSIYIW